MDQYIDGDTGGSHLHRGQQQKPEPLRVDFDCQGFEAGIPCIKITGRYTYKAVSRRSWTMFSGPTSVERLGPAARQDLATLLSNVAASRSMAAWPYEECQRLPIARHQEVAMRAIVDCKGVDRSASLDPNRWGVLRSAS